MYELIVFSAGSDRPLETVRVEHAADVLTVIPTLFDKHKGCERVDVHLQGRKLFSIDCKGNSTPA